MNLIVAILLSTFLYITQAEDDIPSNFYIPPYPTKPNNISYYFDGKVIVEIQNIKSQSIYHTDSEEENDYNIGTTYVKLELLLEEFQNYTCLRFNKTRQPVKEIGINFYVSDDDKNHVELSRSKDNPTILNLTRKVYRDPFKFRYFLAKALGFMPAIQRIDRELELTIFNDSIDENFYQEYEKSTYYYSHFFESDFDFKTAAMPINNLGLKRSSKHNKTYEPYIKPYYELMLEKRYDFSFSDYRQITYMYCNYTYEENQCKNGGYRYTYSNNYSECKCPRGYSNYDCQNIHFQTKTCSTQNKFTAYSDYRTMVLEGDFRNCYINIKASKSMGKVQIYAKHLECNNRCKYDSKIDSIEIKYRDDKGVKGISLFTKDFKPIELPALSNEVTILWIFGGKEFTPKFTFQYREVIPESKWPYWLDEHFNYINNSYFN